MPVNNVALCGLALSSVTVLLILKKMVDRSAYERFVQRKLNFESRKALEFKESNRVVLVTGGNGFLGGHIVELLVKKGINVIVFDLNIPENNLCNPNVSYCRGNLLNTKHIEEALNMFADKSRKVDSVIHTAGLIPYVGVPEKAIWEVNIQGTKNILDVSKKFGVRSFIYTSSATVALDRDNRNAIDLTELDELPINHVDTYAKTKAACECNVRAASNPAGAIATCILRPASIFGSGDKIISDRLVLGQDNIYIGEGTAIIDWVPVEGVAMAHILAEEALSSEQQNIRNQLDGKSYFIGNGEHKEYRWFFGYNTVGESDDVSHWQTPHPKSIPLWLVKILACFNEVWCLFFGVAALSGTLSQVSIDYTQRSYTFRIDQAKKDFGYTPIFSVSEAIRLRVEKHRKQQKKEQEHSQNSKKQM